MEYPEGYLSSQSIISCKASHTLHLQHQKAVENKRRIDEIYPNIIHQGGTMKIACLFDIHGNWPALHWVLTELSQLNIDQIIVGGDIVSGPMPKETMETLFQIKDKIIWIGGNGDDDVLAALSNQPFNKNLSEYGRIVSMWVAHKLGPEFEIFLKGLPIRYNLFTAEYGRMCFCHATPESKEEIFTPATNEAIMKELFKRIDYDIVICGHTHIQFERVVNSVRILNAGSVGMPFSGHHGADWILITSEGIAFKNTQYDNLKAREILARTNYPNITNFIDQNIIHTHDQAQMINYLEKLRTTQINNSR